MTHRLMPFALTMSAVFWLTLAAHAQSPAPAPAPPPAGRPAGPPNSGEPQSNGRTGFQVDRFFGDPSRATARLSHGGLLTREILRSGNPYEPGPAGAVLEFRTQVARATLLPMSRTPLMSLADQYLFQVVSGEGRLDDGTQYWDLRPGISILIPPAVRRRFVNTSGEPLEMVMVEWAATPIARKDILVRDVGLLPFCEESVHWNNMSKCVFTGADGMTGRVLLVMLTPMTAAAPHTHVRGTDEIWTKLTPGNNALLLLGSELREMPQYSAFLAPPDGQTWHGQLNTSKTEVEMWLYVAGGSATTPPAPGAGRPGGGGPGAGNPNLSRDPAVVDQATVKGTPLK